MSKVINELNQLLADSKVFQQNLHNFHWNIQGEYFFELHPMIGELYDAVGADTDIFAERILALKGMPMSKFSDYLRTSNIAEMRPMSDCFKIVASIVDSLNKTVEQLNVVRKAAVAMDDEGTNTLMGDKLLNIEKQLWQYNAFMTRKSKGITNFIK